MKSTNSVSKGDALEERIFDLFKSEIDADAFLVRKECCRIFRRKPYYSRDRESNIVFDVSIEVYYPGAVDHSLLFLIECKHYTHAVPVDDVEEFFVKSQQVAASNSKAILVSTSAFQVGSRRFAKSKGMGLARYFEPSTLKWELYRSASAAFGGSGVGQIVDIDRALDDEKYRSDFFDMYFESSRRQTTALWDFFEDMLTEAAAGQGALRYVINRKGRKTTSVPFIQRSEIEEVAEEALGAIEYDGGYVNLEKLCQQHPATRDLQVVRSVDLLADDPGAPLGRVVFQPPEITVFVSTPAGAFHPRARTCPCATRPRKVLAPRVVR